MTTKEVIKQGMDLAHQVTTAYLSDLEDKDLFVRPADGANHIAWQLGHLIASEHMMMTGIGNEMPALPDGFAEAHSKETCDCDDASKFHTRQEYLDLMTAMHAATKKALDAATDESFAAPAPESMQGYAANAGAVYNMIGMHEMMHVGQMATVRRKLGKPIVI